ncbi:MAG: LptF/LptG family permease [Bacteroidaceae bacterium]|nr:LptF/LptG family permease [Bacteroidaceae bacterium]
MKIAKKIAERIERKREDWRNSPPVNRIDRYLIKKFIGTYFFSIILIIAIVIVFDFNEKIDKLTTANKEFGISWGRIFVDYYLNTIPYFANLFSSLFVFISVIFFTSKLADRSEIIAMRSNGMSFRRILRPYIISAVLIGLLNLVLGAYVIPHSNKIRTDFENQYIKKRQITMVENVQLQVDTGVIAFFSSFNINTKSGSGFSLDKFRNKKLVSHLTALRVQYDTIADRRYQWHIYNYSIRELHGMHEKITSGFELDTIIVVEPRDLLYTRNQQETMTTPEISEYIDKQRMRGSANVSTFEVEYHKRFASAFAAFILTIIGVTLSCEKRKGGMGLSLGLGLALSFGYILFQTISASFATNGGWPPMLAVWIPNIIFSIVAFVLYRRTPR